LINKTIGNLSEITLALVFFTNAELGKGVISNESTPDKVRQTLNVESGLLFGILEKKHQTKIFARHRRKQRYASTYYLSIF